jgi:ABC-type microcin C transport system duplicated ATPase subunit YejF
MRRRMQIVFQDPYGSLNPRMTLREIVGEGIVIHRLARSRDEETAMVEGVLQKVGLRPDMMGRFPHEVSGGQRQRIAIARALVTKPRILVFDEATSALDAESEAIIQNNLQAIARSRTVMIIAHRLSAVRSCQTIIAMEKGRIVERGTHDELLALNGRYATLFRLQNGLTEE